MGSSLFIVASLIVLVVVHELGHFLAARAVGVRATKFYVFFPPALWKRKIGDVEYGIGAIPAGGFVKLPGMFEPQAKETAQRVRWELEAIGDFRGSDAELTVDAALRQIDAATSPDELVDPLEDVHAAIVSRRIARDEAIDAATARREDKSLERIAGILDDCHPKAYWRASLWRRMVVIFAGPFVNLVVAFVLLSVFYWGFIPKQQTDGPLHVASVQAGSPAADAGLTSKSAITKWNGAVAGIDTQQLERRIVDSIGKPVRVTWTNPGAAEQSATVQPAVLDEGEGARIGVLLTDEGFLDIATKVVGHRTTDPVTGMHASLREMRAVTWGNLTRLPQVFFRTEVRKEVGSVVGIVQVADQFDKAGQTLRYVGLISLILAVMNLLPLLPLDGGHLLFGIIEFLRRKPLPRMAFERYSMVGLALVLTLFVIGLNNDIARF
jgi:regulator of sigma E protease